jgi:HSP20 family protein
MSNLTRWEPMREVQTMRNLMDRFFDEPFFNAPQLWSQRNETFPLPLDVIEEEGAYIVKASMPGVNPEQVEITLNDNVLTIKGETKQESDKSESNYHVRERRYGSFIRQIALPAAVDNEKVEATQENGVLTLHLPKAEGGKPKKISVKSVVNNSSQENNGQHGHVIEQQNGQPTSN